jgi:hypothetical protein
MTTAAFLVFVALVAITVVALIARYLNRKTAMRLATGLSLWFVFSGLMGYSGLLRNTTLRPPGAAFLLIPVVILLLLFMLKSRPDTGIAQAFPLWLLLGMQVFRIGVELFLHQLWLNGIVPKMLTFKGANIDIFVGASAPLAAWLSTQGRVGLRFALGWSVFGLIALANVVVRAVLTSPGPLHIIHTEIPNRMIGMFPFLWIPGFFVPLAIALHWLGIQGILARLSDPKDLLRH